MSVSSKNNDHLQRPTNNCLNSVLCVPFIDKNVTARKLSDQEIHKLARTEGKVIWLLCSEYKNYIKIRRPVFVSVVFFGGNSYLERYYSRYF